MKGFIYPKNKNGRGKVGVYVHVPFCLSKCHYCDFCSVLRYGEEQKERYVGALISEMKLFAKKIGDVGGIPKADTVYFGGGTPTLLSPDQFGRLIAAVDELFGIEDGAEITAETNPKSADGNKLKDIRLAGVNRLSIGMQSVHDGELRALGRIHNFEDFKKTYADARDAGFENISADLMYGIPNQTMDSFKESVETLASFGPEHISSYCLTVEEGTNFYRRKDVLDLPDEDTVGDMYAEMSRILALRGYDKYEISNFSRESKESRHNVKYWRCDDYLGFGAAAHGYFAGVRYGHGRDVDAYMSGKSIIIDVESIGREEAMRESALLGMRLARGVDLDEFFANFGVNMLDVFPKFKDFAPRFVKIDDGRCHFTDEGMFVSNYILAEALDFGE